MLLASSSRRPAGISSSSRTAASYCLRVEQVATLFHTDGTALQCFVPQASRLAQQLAVALVRISSRHGCRLADTMARNARVASSSACDAISCFDFCQPLLIFAHQLPLVFGQVRAALGAERLVDRAFFAAVRTGLPQRRTTRAAEPVLGRVSLPALGT